MTQNTITKFADEIATASANDLKSIILVRDHSDKAGFYKAVLDDIKEEKTTTLLVKVDHFADFGKGLVNEINALQKKAIVIINLEGIGITETTQHFIDIFLEQIEDGILCVFVHND